MKFKKCLIVAIFITMFINGISIAEAGDAKIWDTMKKYTYGVYTFQAWPDQANWVQVPYGNTDYQFVGDPVIENGNFWLFLHSIRGEAPFLYANIDGRPGMTGELYGTQLPSWRSNWVSVSTEIITNTAEEVTVKYTSKHYKPEYPGYNTVTYRTKKDSGWIEVKPIGDPWCYQYIHSAPNRFAAAPSNDGTDNDFIVDPHKDWLDLPDQWIRHYPPNTNNDFMLYQIFQGTGDYSMYMMTYANPTASNAVINVKTNEIQPRLSTIGAYMHEDNRAIYLGVINHKNVFRHEDVGGWSYTNPAGGLNVKAGDTYTSSFIPPIPGRWRMSGRVDGNYYTSDVYDGDFTFTSPVNGKLEVVVMYLYDRTAATPADVNTPMDIYRETVDNSAPTPTPTPTPTPSVKPTIDISYTSSPVVDGLLDDWEEVSGVSFEDDSGRGSADNTASVKALWNEDYLYVAFEVADTNLQAVETVRDSALYLDDVVEIYIDTLNNDGSLMQTDDYHFLVNLNNAIADSKGTETGSGRDINWDCSIVSAVTMDGTVGDDSDIDTGYFVEIAIPWSEIGGTPLEGSVIGLDLAIGDRDNIADGYQYFDWSDLTSFAYPDGWGDAVIIDNTAPILYPIGDKSVDIGSPLQFTISASDFDNDPLIYSTSILPGGASFNPTTRTFSWTPVEGQAGTYTVHFEVTDSYLNDSENIMIAVNEPIISPTPSVKPTMNISHTSTPVIDGLKDDWAGMSGVSFKDDSGRGSADNTASVKALWNEDYLYVAFEVADTNLQAVETVRDSALYLDDVVEIYIDTLNNDGSLMQTDDYHFLVNLNNAIADSKGTETGSGRDINWDCSIVSAVTMDGTVGDDSDIDTGYFVEIAIPWSEIGGTPLEGSVIGLDLAIGDRDNIADGYQYFDWSDLTSFAYPDGWGDAVIICNTDVEVTLTLYEGWNLIALPVINDSFTASSLASAIGDVSHVMKRSASDGGYQDYIVGFSGDADDFVISPDEGYYVYLDVVQKDFTVRGARPGTRSIDLVKGWNLVGWTSLDPSDAVAAFYDPLGNKIKYAAKRNSPYGDYEKYVTKFSEPENNFDVEPGYGYFVYVVSDCTWVYD